jgi:iron complex transport system substrate-binding protein
VPKASAPRVASLLPSTTEIVAALGAADLLVGVSHECDWPPEIAQRVNSGELPVLTSARLGPPGRLAPAAAASETSAAALPGVSRSAAIDRRLRELVSAALSVYLVDEAALAACAPDIVLTQDLCEVCAVSYEETCRAVSFMQGADVRVITTHPTSLDDIWGDVFRIGAAIGRERDAEILVASLRSRVEAVARRANAKYGSIADLDNLGPDSLDLADLLMRLEQAGYRVDDDGRWQASDPLPRPRVLTLEWIDPPMPGGLWMGELVELAGGIPIGDQRGAKTHALSREQLEALSPEVLVVKPCGFTLDMAQAELPVLKRVLPWDTWPACREGRVYLCDGSAYFNRPGPRIVDSLELLAACIHPELFGDFGERYAGAYERVEL